MFIAEFTGEAFNKMKKAGFPFPLLLFILLFLVIFPECRSRNSILFYKPFGTTQEIYKKNSDIHITVYPYEGFAKGSVIFIHGGGWQMGGSDLPFYGDWEILLKKAGLRAFSIEHRTAPHYRGKEIIQDCMDAVRYINQNAD
ncbi:MAG: alpha/beta hydrolase, partial [Spirochaetia bacterium]|nr:alpha/beta hydrolase [Spirochaetia bacterium]